MERILEQEQVLPISMKEAWEFFSNPANLDVITPPELRFKIVELDSDVMYSGQIIRYKIRVAPLIWTGWTTKIVDVDHGRSFVDTQLKGPYKLWHHTHTFAPTNDGSVLATDRIRYEVGFGPLGELAHAVFVGKRLKYIFDFRRSKLETLFPD